MSRETYTIRNATVDDHKAILAVAKTSKYTKDFGSHMFSPPSAYEKGWIKVAVYPDGSIVGFTCVRHKVREPKTMLYFITVMPEQRSGFIGERLLKRVMEDGPHDIMALNVMKDNRAVSFYERLGFRIVEDALKGKAHRMEKDWSKS
jgi:ribosomal protein S18 acetylase RimI-like enzyme